MKRNINDIMSDFTTAKELMKDATSDYKAWLKDDTTPLDTRWKIFISAKIGDTSDRTDFDLDRDDEFLYEGPCYMEKYQVRDVADILEALVDDKKFKMTPEEIVIFKEFRF